MKNESSPDEDELMRNADSPTSFSDELEFEFGDFCFETDGSINVAFTNSNITSPIYLIKVNTDLYDSY